MAASGTLSLRVGTRGSPLALAQSAWQPQWVATSGLVLMAATSMKPARFRCERSIMMPISLHATMRSFPGAVNPGPMSLVLGQPNRMPVPNALGRDHTGPRLRRPRS